MPIDMRLLIALLVATAAQAQSPADGPVLGAIAVSPTVGIKGWILGGRVRLVGWDRDSIVVRGTIPRDERLRLLRDTLAAKVVIQSRDETGTKVGRSDVVVYAPRRATFALKSVSADIIGQDVSGWFYSVSGNIRLAGTARSVDAESITGSLDFNISAPAVRAHAGEGHILVRGSPQDVDAATVGGTISIATPTILRGQFSTVSGDIQYAGALAAAGIFDFSTHSGDIDLALPEATSASLALSSIAGPIENGFARVRPTSASPRSMKVRLGRGDAQVAARTFKGTIRFRPQ